MKSGSYSPNKTFISKHHCINYKSLFNLLTKYDNVFLIVDFDVGKNNVSLEDFRQLDNLKHLMKVSNC